MWYWREENFKGLKEVAVRAAENPDTVLYAEYCEFREMGLRKPAFDKLSEFIKTAVKWELEKRFLFVDWVQNILHLNDSIYDLLPHPLYEKIFRPTLNEWVLANPDDPKGYRWLGDIDSLRKAVRLSSVDTISTEKLIDKILHGLNYSVHHLPEGYIGEPSEDLMALNEIKGLIPSLDDPVYAGKCLSAYSDLQELVQSYYEYSKLDTRLDFEGWANTNNRRCGY